MVHRLTVFIPIVASLVAAVLSVVLLAAGMTSRNSNSNYWLSLNMSSVGQVVVHLAQPSETAPAHGRLMDSSIASGPLISNVTTALGNDVEDLQGQIASNLIRTLEVKEIYNLFLNKMCEGDSGKLDGPVDIARCVDYEDKQGGLRKISNSFPDYFILGTTNISVPLVTAMGSTFASIVNLATTSAHALLVLLLIGAGSIGIQLVGSAIVLILTILRRPKPAENTLLFSGDTASDSSATSPPPLWPPAVCVNVCFGTLGALALLAFAGTATGVVVAGSGAVAHLGAAMGIRAVRGESFLVIAWAAAVFGTTAGAYWFAVWFVEVRQTAFRRVRRRYPGELGNWGGIVQEVVRNLKGDGENAKQVSEGKRSGGGGSRRISRWSN
ncbi:hypothetical protein VTK73DRAFT_3972 [Phialemonium thermophilum]|uniref:Uncharacterized protein n=1 Tax=Phialemonium thermophilum TaxID=223376 RepID=A0ABR3WVX5_9PEZI